MAGEPAREPVVPFSGGYFEAVDPFGDWIEEHHAELAMHEGKFVIVDLREGIVASGTDSVELVRTHDPEHTRMLHFVRPGMYAPVHGDEQTLSDERRHRRR